MRVRNRQVPSVNDDWAKTVIRRAHEMLESGANGQHIDLPNKLSSFICSYERSCEIGEFIFATDMPLTKVFFHCGLLPGILEGEDEFLVIGGVAEVTLSLF